MDLKFASRSRSVGATENYIVSGGTNGTDNKIWFTTGPGASALISQGTFFNGGEYAAYDSGGFVRAMNYTTDNAGNGATVAGATDFTAASANGKHVDLTGAITAGITESINSLRLGSTNGVTIGSTDILTLANGGLLKTGGNAATISGGTLATGGTELVVRTDASADKLTIDSQITNTGGLTKTGSGTLVLSNTGTASTVGTVRINDGTFEVTGGNAALPAGTGVTFHGDNSVFKVSGTDLTMTASSGLRFENSVGIIDVASNVKFTYTSNIITDSNSLSFLSGIVKKGAGTFVFGGTGIMNNADSHSAGGAVNSLLRIDEGTFSVTSTSGTALGDTNVSNESITLNGGNFSWDTDNTGNQGQLNKGLNLTANGGGLDNNRATTGAGINRSAWGFGLTVLGGTPTLTVTSNSTVDSGTAVTTINGQTALLGSPTFNVVNPAGAASELRINSFADYGGAQTVTKDGDGTMVITGAATSLISTSAVNVVGGTLLANNTTGSATGDAPVTVGASGTFGGTGAIAGTVNVTGTLSPGASIESLASGALTMNNGAVFVFEAVDNTVTGADLMVVNGDLSLTGVTLDLTSANLGAVTWTVGDILTLISYTGTAVTSGFTGYVDDTPYAFGSNSWLINYDDTLKGNNYNTEATGSSFVTLTMVPEPAAALLGILGLLPFLRRRRGA